MGQMKQQEFYHPYQDESGDDEALDRFEVVVFVTQTKNSDGFFEAVAEGSSEVFYARNRNKAAYFALRAYGEALKRLST